MNLEVQYRVHPLIPLTGMIIVSTDYLWRAVAGSVKMAPTCLVESQAYPIRFFILLPPLMSSGSKQIVPVSLECVHFFAMQILIHFHMESMDGFHPGRESIAHS